MIITSITIRVPNNNLVRMKSGSVVGKDAILQAIKQAQVDALASWKAEMATRVERETPVGPDILPGPKTPAHTGGTLKASILGSLDAATLYRYKLRADLAIYRGKPYGYMVKNRARTQNLMRLLNKAGYSILRNKVNSHLKTAGLQARFNPGGVDSLRSALGALNRAFNVVGGLLRIIPLVNL